MSAPNLKEIEWAISELEQEESSEKRYTLLAALYTCRNELLGLSAPQPQIASYSEAASPSGETLGQYGDSDFLRAVSGKNAAAVWSVMNEHMRAIRVVNPNVYEGVMRKLKGI